jgi:hypothetical protein
MNEGHRKQVLTTLHFPRRAAWRERVDVLRPDRGRGPALARTLVRASKRYDAMVVDADGRPLDQMAAAVLIARRRRRPRVIFADCAWGVGGSLLDRLTARAAVRLIDGPHVHYCVHARDHQHRFPEIWRVESRRVHLTPYYYTLSEEELALPLEHDGSVFAGGDSYRDYAPLIEASLKVSAPMTLATERLSAEQRSQLPARVRAGRISHAEFVTLMSRASVVVVALEHRSDRSAGEQTYLNAMAMGKPVIVTDTMGVRDYVEHEQTGLIVPPRDPDALAHALEWALNPANEPAARAMGERARQVALARFGPDNYVAGLLSVIDSALASG